MKSIFLSHEQLFEKPLPVFQRFGTLAPPTDLALLTCRDDGFLTETGTGINYYLAGDGCVDRFGRENPCAVCAIRPAFQLEAGEEALLKPVPLQKDTAAAGPAGEARVVPVLFGTYPTAALDASLQDLAMKRFREGTLRETGQQITIRGEKHSLYRLGAKRILALSPEEGNANGYVQLSDGSVVSEGDLVFLECRPVRWLWDEKNALLVAGQALFGGCSREEAAAYLAGSFRDELLSDEDEGLPSAGESWHISSHTELSLIRAYVEANVPVFIHGLSGDGKSDRVREIDPQALDIELVNETPETINGRAVYNEALDQIIDIKPAWLVRLERLCEDGQLHILFFDELTNATKQTQSVIFKIVLERFVNNRWSLPQNARIVAAGNDRSESTAAHDLAEPLFGRFAHIYIRTVVDNWMPWAVRKGINPCVMEFLANNHIYLRTPFTGTAGYADPRRWEMVSRVLDLSGNDFSLLEPIVGPEVSDAFLRFFRAREELTAIGDYSDSEIASMSVPRRYQMAQQCLLLAAARPEEAEKLVARLGAEYVAWFHYMLRRRQELLA